MTAEKIANKHKELFGNDYLLVKSPGRINIIGEHTDYNDGFVLPAAIDKAIYITISARTDNEIHLYSFDFDQKYQTNSEEIHKSGMHWANYLLGVIDELFKDGYRFGGFNCVFGGDIPIGAGLSSSAAIECGLTYALNSVYGLKIAPKDIALISQRAENNFVGLRCGIMDQYVNVFGKKKSVILLDCKDLSHNYYPLRLGNYTIVLCDSHVKHSLASTEYNVRRRECETGVTTLKKYNPGITSLRDVTIEMLNEHKSELTDTVYKRCKYVLEENTRVHEVCTNLSENKLTAVGESLYATHIGLRDEYEVSCSEVDVLFDIAYNHPGVIGSRMMGGGFGGCTLNIVDKHAVKDFINTVEKEYEEKTGMKTIIYKVKTEDGTHIL